MSVATQRHDDVHELALVERELVWSSVEGHEVLVGDGGGARIWFDTWEPNPAFRGDILAGICTEIATSEHWELVRVHDPLERDEGMVRSGVTIRRDPGDGDV